MLARPEEEPVAYETIETELSEGVLTLTLSRPDRLNAFNAQMMTELLEELDRIDADDEHIKA